MCYRPTAGKHCAVGWAEPPTVQAVLGIKACGVVSTARLQGGMRAMGCKHAEGGCLGCVCVATMMHAVNASWRKGLY